MSCRNHIKIKLFSAGIFISLLIISMTLLSGCYESSIPAEYYNPSTGQTTGNFLTVTGKGAYKVNPDTVVIEISIVTEKDTSQESVDENSKISQKVIDAVKSIGIKDLKIETSYYNLEPLYYYSENKPPEIYSYRVTNTLNISTVEIEKIGQVIADAIETGATNLNSLSFELSDNLKSEAKKFALENAAKDAALKAKAMADSFGLNLKEIFSVREVETYYPERIYGMGGFAEKAAADQEITPPVIETQEIEVTATIEMNYTFN